MAATGSFVSLKLAEKLGCVRCDRPREVLLVTKDKKASIAGGLIAGVTVRSDDLYFLTIAAFSSARETSISCELTSSMINSGCSVYYALLLIIWFVSRGLSVLSYQ